jgi:hypothetical protein
MEPDLTLTVEEMPRASISSRKTTAGRYAWLEMEDGMWHFVTDVLADPSRSVRRWSDKQLALEELNNEGWTVVHEYRRSFAAGRRSAQCLQGCGLTRKLQ